MKVFGISKPITGILYKEIEAKSEKEAMDAFHKGDLTIDDVIEWEMHETIVQGNVFYGMLNQAEVELVDEYEED